MRFFIGIFFIGAVLSPAVFSIDTSINTFNIHNKSDKKLYVIVTNSRIPVHGGGIKIKELGPKKDYGVVLWQKDPTKIVLLEKRGKGENTWAKLRDKFKDAANIVSGLAGKDKIFGDYNVICEASFSKDKTVYIKYKYDPEANESKSSISPQDGVNLGPLLGKRTTQGYALDKNVLPGDIFAKCAE